MTRPWQHRDITAEAAPPRLTSTARRAAAVTVCGHAPGRDEARLLLDILGLLQEPPPDGALHECGEWISAPARGPGIRGDRP